MSGNRATKKRSTSQRTTSSKKAKTTAVTSTTTSAPTSSGHELSEKAKLIAFEADLPEGQLLVDHLHRVLPILAGFINPDQESGQASSSNLSVLTRLNSIKVLFDNTASTFLVTMAKFQEWERELHEVGALFSSVILRAPEVPNFLVSLLTYRAAAKEAAGLEATPAGPVTRPQLEPVSLNSEHQQGTTSAGRETPGQVAQPASVVELIDIDGSDDDWDFQPTSNLWSHSQYGPSQGWKAPSTRSRAEKQENMNKILNSTPSTTWTLVREAAKVSKQEDDPPQPSESSWTAYKDRANNEGLSEPKPVPGAQQALQRRHHPLVADESLDAEGSEPNPRTAVPLVVGKEDKRVVGEYLDELLHTTKLPAPLLPSQATLQSGLFEADDKSQHRMSFNIFSDNDRGNVDPLYVKEPYFKSRTKQGSSKIDDFVQAEEQQVTNDRLRQVLTGIVATTAEALDTGWASRGSGAQLSQKEHVELLTKNLKTAAAFAQYGSLVLNDFSLKSLQWKMKRNIPHVVSSQLKSGSAAKLPERVHAKLTAAIKKRSAEGSKKLGKLKLVPGTTVSFKDLESFADDVKLDLEAATQSKLAAEKEQAEAANAKVMHKTLEAIARQQAPGHNHAAKHQHQQHQQRAPQQQHAPSYHRNHPPASSSQPPPSHRTSTNKQNRNSSSYTANPDDDEGEQPSSSLKPALSDTEQEPMGPSEAPAEAHTPSSTFSPSSRVRNDSAWARHQGSESDSSGRRLTRDSMGLDGASRVRLQSSSQLDSERIRHDDSRRRGEPMDSREPATERALWRVSPRSRPGTATSFARAFRQAVGSQFHRGGPRREDGMDLEGKEHPQTRKGRRTARRQHAFAENASSRRAAAVQAPNGHGHLDSGPTGTGKLGPQSGRPPPRVPPSGDQRELAEVDRHEVGGPGVPMAAISPRIDDVSMGIPERDDPPSGVRSNTRSVHAPVPGRPFTMGPGARGGASDSDGQVVGVRVSSDQGHRQLERSGSGSDLDWMGHHDHGGLHSGPSSQRRQEAQARAGVGTVERRAPSDEALRKYVGPSGTSKQRPQTPTMGTRGTSSGQSGTGQRRRSVPTHKLSEKPHGRVDEAYEGRDPGLQEEGGIRANHLIADGRIRRWVRSIVEKTIAERRVVKGSRRSRVRSTGVECRATHDSTGVVSSDGINQEMGRTLARTISPAGNRQFGHQVRNKQVGIKISGHDESVTYDRTMVGEITTSASGETPTGSLQWRSGPALKREGHPHDGGRQRLGSAADGKATTDETADTDRPTKRTEDHSRVLFDHQRDGSPSRVRGLDGPLSPRRQSTRRHDEEMDSRRSSVGDSMAGAPTPVLETSNYQAARRVEGMGRPSNEEDDFIGGSSMAATTLVDSTAGNGGESGGGASRPSGLGTVSTSLGELWGKRGRNPTVSMEWSLQGVRLQDLRTPVIPVLENGSLPTHNKMLQRFLMAVELETQRPWEVCAWPLPHQVLVKSLLRVETDMGMNATILETEMDEEEQLKLQAKGARYALTAAAAVNKLEATMALPEPLLSDKTWKLLNGRWMDRINKVEVQHTIPVMWSEVQQVVRNLIPSAVRGLGYLMFKWRKVPPMVLTGLAGTRSIVMILVGFFGMARASCLARAMLASGRRRGEEAMESLWDEESMNRKLADLKAKVDERLRTDATSKEEMYDDLGKIVMESDLDRPTELFLVTMSKTGWRRIHLSKGQDPDFSPVDWTWRWLVLRRLVWNSATRMASTVTRPNTILSGLSRGHWFSSIKPQTVAKINKKSLQEVMSDGVKTGHGLRAGGATQAVLNGVPLPIIAKYGGWKSPETIIKIYLQHLTVDFTSMLQGPEEKGQALSQDWQTQPVEALLEKTRAAQRDIEESSFDVDQWRKDYQEYDSKEDEQQASSLLPDFLLDEDSEDSEEEDVELALERADTRTNAFNGTSSEEDKEGDQDNGDLESPEGPGNVGDKEWLDVKSWCEAWDKQTMRRMQVRPGEKRRSTKGVSYKSYF